MGTLKTDAEQLHATKIAILNAAERLFAAHGFKATSLRAITSEARANLGAVNYHFASKNALILAVLGRRMRPLNAERVALLTSFEEEAGDRPLSCAKILEALFRPALELISSGGKGGRNFVRLLSQCLAEPGKFLQPLVQEEFSEKNLRFHAALRRALPHLSSDETHWRLHFAYGVFLHTIAHAHVLEWSSNGRCRLSGRESVLERMIDFCAAGLQQGETKLKGKTKRAA